MKQEEIFITLIKELIGMDEVHYEYTDNNSKYVLDSLKNGDEVIIKISKKENKDKKDFENWVNQMDGDLFNEVWETLSEEDNLHSLDELYNSENYKEVISKFKNKTKELASNKIKELQKYLG